MDRYEALKLAVREHGTDTDKRALANARADLCRAGLKV